MMLNPMYMHIVTFWCTESCWLFAHFWVVYKRRFYFLTSLCFLSLVDTLLSSGHGEYLRNMFPDTALHDSECARSQMWLLFFNVGPQACVTPSKWTIAAAADVHLFSEIHLAYFQVCWLTRRTQYLLVITEDSPLLPRFCSEFQSWHIFPACSFNHSRLTSVNHPSWFYCPVHTRSVWLFVKDEALALGVAV